MKARLLALFFLGALLPSASGQGVLITEFKAINDGPLLDQFSFYSDWIELFNPGPAQADLGGWYLTDRASALTAWQFPATNIPPGGFLIVFASGRNLRVPGGELHTSFGLAGGGEYLALVRPDGVTVEQEFNPTYPPQRSPFSYGFPMSGNVVQTNTPAFLQQTPGLPNPPAGASLPLVLTELMFHPAPPPAGNPSIADDFEFVELKNTGTNTIELAGTAFHAGINFIFPSNSLAPGQRILVVNNLSVFRSRYPNITPIAGEFSGSLADSSERLALRGLNGAAVFDFNYNDSWHPTTDGHGFSLVPVDEDAPAARYGLRSAWRASGQFHGSPAQADPPSSVPPIYVNEVLTRSAAPFEDAIELFNPNTNDVDISGWFLTDDFDEPMKYRLPNGAFVPAGGYLALDEHAFNTPNEDPLAVGFGLADFGEEIFLFSADAGGLTGYAHGFAYPTAETNVPFGRHVLSTGEERFVPQTAMTFLAPNGPPKIGPVIISEVHYRDLFRHTFIELRNLTADPLPLYDPLFPTNGWRLGSPASNGPAFTFPPGAVLPPHGYALVVGFNPAHALSRENFLATNNVTPGTLLYGPWEGSLGSTTGHVQLLRPDAPELFFVPYLIVDEVNYTGQPPWPSYVGGRGAPLHRINEGGYGEDPAHWAAGMVTPGLPGGLPPALVQPLLDQVAPAHTALTFDATAVGTVPILYQWHFNGSPLPGATNSRLFFENLRLPDAGLYSCFLSNAAFAGLTRQATLTVLDTTPPVLTITTAPGPFLRVTTPSLTIAGTATDDVLLSSIVMQRGGASPTLIPATANWSTTVQLLPGLNNVSFHAVDWSGNPSSTNTLVVFFQTNAARFGLFLEGAGTVAGPRHNAVLAPGRSYTVRATPAPGWLFSHWLDWSSGQQFTNPLHRFVMASNLTLTARFLPGPFLPLAGAWDGLFHHYDSPAHLNAGWINLRVTSRGAYSGRLGWPGASSTLHGTLGDDLSFTKFINRPGTNDLFLRATFNPATRSLYGTVSESRFTSELNAHRSGFADLNSATNFAGRYQALLSTTPPSTNSSATLTVTRAGLVLLRGRLPDRTPLVKNIWAGDDSLAPLHLPLYRNAGSLFGWLDFAHGPTNHVQAPLLWSRTGRNGFTNYVEVTGQK